MSALTPRQAERRERILKTVREHLGRYGYDGLSMRDIAEHAGVSPTTLYNLFANKDGLILAAQEDLLAELVASVEDRGEVGIKRLIGHAESIAGQVLRSPSYAEAMTRILFNSSPTDAICKALLGNLVHQNRVLLHEMVELGELRKDLDVDLFARILAGDAWGSVLLWMKGFIALHDFEREYVRRLMMTLEPVMMPKARRIWRADPRGG